MTNIYLAALRDPFTAAKSVATAAAFNEGRVACGLSAGWIKEEYDLLNIDFASRGKRLDEVIQAMRTLWRGERVQHHGQFFDFDAIMCPAPKQPVPIWCGGDSKPALRRAALNDGWLPLPMTVAAMTDAATRLYSIRDAAGLPRDGYTICFAPAEPYSQGMADGLSGLGIDDVIVIAPWLPSPWDVARWTDPDDDFALLEVKQKAMRRFAETIIARYGTVA